MMKRHFTTLVLPHGDPLIGAKVRLKADLEREGVIIGRHERFGYEVKWLTKLNHVGLYLLGELDASCAGRVGEISTPVPPLDRELPSAGCGQQNRTEMWGGDGR